MNALLSLWLPILLSAVTVFVISSLIHMVIKWHASEYRSLSNEDAVRAVIRAGHPAPGSYVVPHCPDMKDMGSDAMKQKYAEGPVGHITIVPNGTPNMGKYLGLWFLWSLAIAVVAAFLRQIPAGCACFNAPLPVATGPVYVPRTPRSAGFTGIQRRQGAKWRAGLPPSPSLWRDKPDWPCLGFSKGSHHFLTQSAQRSHAVAGCCQPGVCPENPVLRQIFRQRVWALD